MGWWTGGGGNDLDNTYKSHNVRDRTKMEEPVVAVLWTGKVWMNYEYVSLVKWP